VTGGCRKLHNEELQKLYSSPNITRMVMPKNMRWAGHVARMGRRGRVTGGKARRKEAIRNTKM
jgi:hypothetical protein